MDQLKKIFGEQQEKPSGLRGILQTKDYSEFIILSDTGNKLHTFSGAKLANKCLPGDHINWDEKCNLELRDEHPLIIGTIELTNKSKYGYTSKHIPIYLFTPYNKSYPHFIVGCSVPPVKNLIGLIKFDKWDTTFPRGQLQQVLGISGDYEAEKQALVWQASPYKYPKGSYVPETKENAIRRELSGFTFNIDPEGCRDVDDVLTFEQSDKGWNVAITISDVARYVEDGSVIDIFASLIGQTLYDNGVPIRPMLPKEYSENVCSLIPGKISYGITLQFLWNNEINEINKITNIEWFESILTTDKSYTYDEFNSLPDTDYKKVLKEIASYLANDINSEITDSHKWIEQCMLFYNKEAGKMLKKAEMGILRRHSAPNLENLKKLEKYPELKHLAFSSAEYCLAEEESIHYGLESEHYAHASSPIRRYADVVNQRIIKLLLKSDETYIVPLAMYDMNYRAKLNKNFERDLYFLDAISTNRTFKGIILDKNIIDSKIKIKIYIYEWKRSISVTYKYDGKVWSRDEKREIDVTDFGEVEINCSFNVNARNWKERVIINII